MAKAPDTPFDSLDVEKRSVDWAIPSQIAKDFNEPDVDKVSVVGDFAVDASTGKQKQKSYDLNQMGLDWRMAIPDLEAGRKYQFHFVIKKNPPGTPDVPIKNSGKEFVWDHVKTDTSPSPYAPTSAVSANIEKRVRDVIEGLKAPESVAGADALIQRLETELIGLGVTAPHTLRILEAVNKVLGEMKTLPVVLRGRFENQPPPANVAELRNRMQEGSRAFRRQVLLSLGGDKKTRESLHLEPHGDSFHFHDPHMATVFNRVCNRFDLGNVEEYLGDAFNSVENVSPCSPALTTSRRALLTGVLTRLGANSHPHEPGILAQVPAGRWGKMVDVVTQLGSAGLLLTWSAPVVGASVLGGKAALETLSGVSSTDIIKAIKGDGGHGHGGHEEGLWSTLKKNNIIARMLTTQGKSSQVLGERLGDFIKRLVPFTSFSYGGKGVGGEAHGHEEHHEEHGAEHHGDAEAESLIRAVCEKEIK